MPKEKPEYLERIAADPKVMGGKLVVRGTRVPVASVIHHLAENPDLIDLLEAFPHLTVDDIKACLAYAHASIERDRGRLARTLANDGPTSPG